MNDNLNQTTSKQEPLFSQHQKCLHHLFEKQVRISPQLPAVIMDQDYITYQELNIRANQLAHYLQSEKHIVPDTPITVWMDSSIEMVISLMAILKSGGAYLPIDSDVPKQRVLQIMEEAKSSLCLYNLENEKYKFQNNNKFRFWSEILLQLDSYPKNNTNSPVSPENIVSVYYTSGTTGKPKCVANLHKGYVNKMLSMQKDYCLVEGESVIQKASIAFDDSSVEIFWPLSAGGQVVLMKPGLNKDPKAILDILIKYRINYMYIVSSMLNRVLDEVSKEDYKRLELKGVFAGADPLTPYIVKRFFESCPGNLYNTWGSTEISIDATIHKCTYEDTLQEGVICIGKPYDNVFVYILNENLLPVKKGEVGDLYVGGEGVSKGYINDTARTTKVFLDNPFRDGSIYKTGDKAFQREDESIMFLGREDNQVKLRGIRIELDEIDVNIRKHPKVKEAITLLREDVPGSKKIVSYVILMKKNSLTSLKMKKWMSTYLPQYMIPHFIVFLDKMPLNQNNKIDKKSLPIPSLTRSNIHTKYTPPQSSIEKEITSIISNVLHIDQVGINDDFFEIGGDSLSATQVIANIRKLTENDISLSVIFERKTVAKISEHIRQIESKKIGENIRRIDRNSEYYHASYAQENLWLFQEIEKQNPVYNEPIAFNIKGSLNIKILKESILEIVRRHESLRTSFRVEKESLVQVVSPNLSSAIDLIEHDLLQLSAPAQEKFIEREINTDCQKAFDIKNEPLFRVRLFKKNENEFVLYFNLHHLIIDGWSIVVLLEELNVIYDSLVNNRLSPLDPLEYQYVDYSSWQKSVDSEEKLSKKSKFWKRELENIQTYLQLPTDFARPKIQAYEGDKIYFSIDKDVVSNIKRLAAENNVTEYMFFLSVFNILIHRYSNQKDILVGTTVANRQEVGLSNMIGFIANTVPIKSTYEPNLSYNHYLEILKSQCFKVFENQEYPFERLVKDLQPERNTAYSPIIQVMFAYQNKLSEKLILSNLEVEPIQINNKTSKYDLTLSLVGEEYTFDGFIEFNSTLFAKSTIQRLVDNYLFLLNQLLIESNKKISEYQITSYSEQEKLMKFNQTKRYFTERCLHELFEEQVQRTPHQEAVIYGKESLTYLELDTASNKLAHYLIQHGVQRNDVIPICIERSTELVVSLLAILKSGGAFLPLDTEAPSDRLLQILSEVNPKVALVHSSFTRLINEGVKNVIEVDLDKHELDKHPSTKPDVSVDTNDLVSVYFTSGSTGVPKGVANAHKGWVNRFIWMQRKFNLKEGETVLQKTTLSFDDSAIELFWPLIAGGRVAMLEPYMHKDPRAIINAAIMYKAIHLQFVPSMLDMVLDEITNEDIKRLDSLRSCVSSGEELKPDIVKRYLERLPGKLFNTWGATEVSIDSTIHTCSIEDTNEHGNISVGKPIDNNRIYVLDENLMQVPRGVVGELYIAGVGLAKGYLNNKIKTEQSFLDDPFVEGEQMYKTGDLGYFRKDGSIKFIGRTDNQVKIRGMRVELGEIEHVLRKNIAIKDAIVLVKEKDDIKRLIAYIIKSDLSKDVEIQTIRESISKELPNYMVPSFYFPLTKFPLNSNGKVDRNHISSLDVSFQQESKKYVSPQTPAEEALANLWTLLLKLEQVGVNDNFFDLGGHSLLATQLVSRIRNQMGIELPLRTVFLKPVLNELAVEIEEILVNKLESLSEEETNVWLEKLSKNQIF